MSTRIRLQRHGKKGKPFFHIVVADQRAKRDGRFIEKLGTYNPNTNPATIDLDFDRSLNWIQNGAQPSDTARAILSYRGVLMMDHLLRGVKKGALTEDQAKAKFDDWVNSKEAIIQKKREGLAKSEEDQKSARLAAEKEVSDARAAAQAAEAQAETAAAEADEAEDITEASGDAVAAVAEVAGEAVEAVKEVAEDVVEAVKEAVDSVVSEEEAPKEEAKEEAPAEEAPAEEAKEEAPAEEAKEEAPAEEAKEEAPAEEAKEEAVSEESKEEKKEG